MPAFFTHNTQFSWLSGLLPLKRWTQMLLQAVFLSPTGAFPSLLHHNRISLLPCSKPGIKSLLCFASTGQAESSLLCYKDTRAICLPVHIDNDMCLDTTICWFTLLWFSYIPCWKTSQCSLRRIRWSVLFCIIWISFNFIFYFCYVLLTFFLNIAVYLSKVLFIYLVFSY